MKGIHIKENQRRAEAAETTMLRIGKVVNDNIVHFGKDITKANEALEIIYGQTPAGMWERFKKWLSKKK
jgi:hypothetical protein